jgi:protein CpxP
MKKLIIAALLIGATSFAQEKTNHKQLTPEQRTEKRLEHLKKDLQLNSQQEKQVKQALLDQETSVAVLKANKKDRKQDQKLSKEEKLAFKSQVIKEQETMGAKLKTILTPEQFKKWESGKNERMEKMKKEMKEHQ